MCSMIELVLMMLGKMSSLSDGEIVYLRKTDWNLFEFVTGLIQALSLDVKFGGYSGYGYGAYKDDYRKEIKVGIFIVSK